MCTCIEEEKKVTFLLNEEVMMVAHSMLLLLYQSGCWGGELPERQHNEEEKQKQSVLKDLSLWDVSFQLHQVCVYVCVFSKFMLSEGCDQIQNHLVMLKRRRKSRRSFTWCLSPHHHPFIFWARFSNKVDCVCSARSDLHVDHTQCGLVTICTNFKWGKPE